MKVMEKNDYLRGLEDLYKKHGITEVYSSTPPKDCIQNGTFKINVTLPPGVVGEIMDYVATEDDSVYGCYLSVAVPKRPERYYLYYSHGTFYTI